ncbi:MAG TPA: alpha/beta hydrolase [Thermoleophilaceae bacterium]
MEHRTGHFDGARGVRIFWQAWLPEGEPRGVVALAHGISEHSGRYAWTGEQLVARGYAVYALDHRGHGQSAGDRAVIDSVANAVADLGELIAIAEAGSAGQDKPFLLGHSFGGFLSLAFATRRQEEIRGLLLSAPAAVLEAASPIQRLAGHVLSAIAPKLGVFTVDPTTVSRDPQVVRDYDADPLNYHGKLPARTVHEMAQEIGRFPQTVPNITVPLLVQVGTGDQLVPPQSSELVYGWASSEDKTIKHYDGLFHEILNEPERDAVVADTLAWLDAHTN